MKFSAAIAPLAFATTAVAGWGNWNKACLSDAEVQNIVSKEIIFLQHTDIATAQAAAYSIFDPAIVEYGDSINSLRQAPLGTIVEPDRETYVNNTLSAPGVPEIVTNDIVYDCHNIVWRWSFYGIGNNINPRVNGFALIKTNAAKLVDYQYIEFNSLAWAVNSGYTLNPPTTGPFAPQSTAKARRSLKA